jgi:GNAT superfamily N-acetyltransferase
MAVTQPSPVEHKPFLAPAYDLGGGLRLSCLTANEAAELAPMVAGMDPWASYPITAEQLLRFLAEVEPGAPRFAVRVDGTLAGTMTIRTNWFRGPYIQVLALAPVAQGRQIGSKLLQFVEDQAGQAAERNLWVAATETNTGALRFYERHGYVRIVGIDGLVRADRTEVLLRKRLRD